ncbi:MAG TPA: sulfotransferase [Streptosporangiaceae bacterium]
MSLTFVVSTGRCGSTALSRVLREHPDVLSVSELFSMLKGTLRHTGFPAHEMDGAQLWRILTARDAFADARIRAGLATPEMTYPYTSGRFSPVTGVPIICHNMLPMLSDDPDALFALLAGEVPGWPARPAADQYRALFAFLGGLLGRPVVVERSGASLTIVRALHRRFPEARFIHLHRDGPDCALSMSRHPVFRLAGLTAAAAQAAGVPAALPWDAAEAQLRRLRVQGKVPPEFAGLIDWPFDAERYMSYPLPVAFFGELWSWLMCEGVPALAELTPGGWISLRYEDLLREPTAQLARLAEFIGVAASPRWLARATDLLSRPGGASAAAELERDELASLRAACEPGTRAIAAAPAHLAVPAGSRT